MSHTIVTETCEGVADCVDACPVACIHPGPGKNVKGTDWYWIDF
ncbi:MAG TPA: ferredoxin, partial [Cyanobacteria bacterium UBA11370]|nr:ferredoxin [Cyanobacteria bacterium UBA11370]